MSFSYFTKPVIVQAFPFAKLESSDGSTVAFPQWLIPAILNGTIKASNLNPDTWYCTTKNGDVVINPTDMLIHLDDGEIYPCDIQVFNNKYEACPEETQDR